MEAATHSHDHGPAIELNPATWRDAKRYAWLLGLIIPFAPFIAWASVEVTGFEAFWFFGPLLVFVAFPILDIVIGMDATNPPDSVLKWLEQDRYYRWCTYLFIPIQYAGLVFACWLWSSGDLSVLESLGLALTMGVVGGMGFAIVSRLACQPEIELGVLREIPVAGLEMRRDFFLVSNPDRSLTLPALKLKEFLKKWLSENRPQ